MSGINRETMRGYLQNKPLVQALRGMEEANETKKALRDALMVMQTVGIGEAAQAEVQAKIEEYKTINLNYDRMIEDTWHITWQTASIIKKYLDHDINDLPEVARF
jgi:hypothetical protein